MVAKSTQNSKESTVNSDAQKFPIFVHSQLDDLGLDPYEFRVYARIARRAGKGNAFESIKNMALGCRMSEGKLKSSLRSLIRRGMIKRISRPGYTTDYCLTDMDKWISPEEMEQLPKTDKEGWVYLVEATGSGRYKIGYTTSVVKRLADLSQQSCFPLIVVGKVFVEECISFEFVLHRKYKQKRVHGEWFELTQQEVDEILAEFSNV